MGASTRHSAGPLAQERFANEVKVLRHLEARGCDFVPRLLSVEPENLKIITTNCGSRVDHLDPERMKALFAELLPFGVRHDDPQMRNVTYRTSDGRFCLIDFEFAALLAENPPPPPPRLTFSDPACPLAPTAPFPLLLPFWVSPGPA